LILINQNRTRDALNYLRAAERIIEKEAFPFNLEMLNIYSEFYEIYYSLKDYRKVALYQSRYIKLRDSIYSESLTTALMKIESDHQQLENIKKIAEQEEVLLLKERIIKSQLILNLVTGLLGFITLCFLLLLFRTYKRKDDMNRLLDKKIKERTHELEVSRNEMVKGLNEQDLLLNRILGLVGVTVKTIKGLSLMGAQEGLDSNARSYIDKINEAVENLNGHLKTLHHKGDSR
jgi:hypothetical protein